MQADLELVWALLRRYDPSVEPDQWHISALSRGGQSQTFLANRNGSESGAPAEFRAVIKVFNPDVAEVKQALRDEYSMLSLIGTSLADCNVGEWAVSSPSPLLISDDPPALIMSFVPGRELDELLRRAESMPRKLYVDLAGALASALGKIWLDHFRIIGDINYRNILCDVHGRKISIIDPGLPLLIYQCDTVQDDSSPASRDLGYILFDVCATNTKIRLTYPEFAGRRIDFVETLIVKFMREFVSDAESEDFLREVYDCAKVHITRLDLSLSPAGIWRRWVALVTKSELPKALENIRAAL